MSTDPLSSAFSAAGDDAITRTIDIAEDPSAQRLPVFDFADFYEIERTASAILDGDFKRVALQFPDELLPDSVPIYRLLKKRVGEGHDLYVLADTSYGSCCVDEVAAQHVDADMIVHYGRACMSQTSRLPVVYVFGRKLIDVDVCVNKLAGLITTSISSGASESQRQIVLRHDVAYSYRADEIVNQLRSKVEAVGVAVLYHQVPTRLDPPPASTPSESNGDSKTSEPNHEHSDLEPNLVAESSYTIIYIGGESLGLTNLLMTHSSCEVHSYDPSTGVVRQESGRTNKLLMRRYATVQKARDADVFGILVGTLGVASYLPLISHLRKLLARARKKSYTISVGKLNPAKLANFMEVECFVLVACPENSIIEAKEFFKPIITPFELEVALQAEGTWSGRYVLDFGRILAEHNRESDLTPDGNEDEEEQDPDRPTFSLVTGQYRHAKRYGDGGSQSEDTSNDPTAVILRNQDGTVSRLADSAAAIFLQSRTYQGLEARIGEDAPSILEQGRSGIARGYADDHQPNRPS